MTTKADAGSPFSDFETDENLEREGIWLDFGKYRIKIAAAGPGNPRFEARRAAAFKPYRYLLQNGTLSEDVARTTLIKVYADTIILDWERVTSRDGAVMEFTRETCIALMTALPRLFAAVCTESEKLSNFRSDEQAEIVKNS